ncbi:MAG: TusE/DsrC/DsvC family sulfur relay protein [Rhodocyclaceae bacterium]|nr:TusE/DsrC/DsvC family sulfur relay protein [Rhodocyclaceae bacterium]
MQTNPFAICTEYVDVNGEMIAADQAGYIQDMYQWSEDLAIALAKKQGNRLAGIRRTKGEH